MLFEEIKSQAYELDIQKIRLEDYSYITDNLKYPLYEWQKNALENFLLNEKIRVAKSAKGEALPPNHLMFNMATGSGKTLVMAALILYYYKRGFKHFIFFVNQNAILGKTQANFIDKNHSKYLFKENVVIDGVHVNFKEVEMFSDAADGATVQIKFTTIQKLHNDIYKESEDSLLLSDLQKRDLILFGDEAHHLNATTGKRKDYQLKPDNDMAKMSLPCSTRQSSDNYFSDISFMGELKLGAKEEDVERSWETTVCKHILNKGGKNAGGNKNALLEFTATIPETAEVQKKYEDKIIAKFGLKEFVEAGCTKHIRLVRSNLALKERVLQALLLNWYRYAVAAKRGIANFKPVILFRSKTIEDSKRDYAEFLALCKQVKASDFDFVSHSDLVRSEESHLQGDVSRSALNMTNEARHSADFARHSEQREESHNRVILNECEESPARDVSRYALNMTKNSSPQHDGGEARHSDDFPRHSERSEKSHNRVILNECEESPARDVSRYALNMTKNSSPQHDGGEARHSADFPRHSDLVRSEESAYTLSEKIFERINIFIKQNNFNYSQIADYIKENFGERNVIITNSKSNKTKKEQTDGETDRLLNSLEDSANHIRAIFTVQRLTEGWDVLNLYDIVRMYTGRDTNSQTKKAGSGTTSEVQLIGRGVRYFPFSYENKDKSRRKFDDDLQNELRVLEEFYFHSDDDVKYISELSAELKRTGYFAETRTQKVFRLKDEAKKQLAGMYLFVNEREENPDRKLRTLPEDFKKIPPFEERITTALYSQVRAVNFTGEDDELAAASSENFRTKFYTFADFINGYRNVCEKAVRVLNANSASYFSFENLRRRFAVESMDDFFDFIKDAKIVLTSDAALENISRKTLLEMFERFFMYCQDELEKYDNPFVGTDFKRVPFLSRFSEEKEKLINIDKNDFTAQENIRLENEICSSGCKWYAVDSFWGTSEERNLINFVKNNLSDLNKKYDKVCLLRNEEVYKIFSFDKGEGFQPDFLLLLRGKENGGAYYQIFVEPKSTLLAESDNDGWKEEFLLEISRRYGFTKPIEFAESSEKYMLVGLPFFNESDGAMKERFNKAFVRILQ